jgi:catechol 2,3-dioxygenase-like lactoylglutathione lyase family enzyme
VAAFGGTDGAWLAGNAKLGPSTEGHTMIVGMNHFTVTAEDERQTLDFYVGLIGLAVGPRPDLGFPGAWLYAGPEKHAVLHLVFGRPMPAVRTGVIDHMAFSATGLAAAKARFDARGVPYTLGRQAGAGTWQLFCHDPNGAKVELDFDAAETV